MASCDAALERLCAPAYEVSAHYLVARHGDVYQMVAEDQRAWHAGAGSWDGQGDVNSRSIGIELDNSGHAPFAAAQMDSLETLLRGIMQRWEIPASGIIGHSDMAPTRKADPGRRFDWKRLAMLDLAAWPGDLTRQNPDKVEFMKAAQKFGYGAEYTFDAVLNAFRQRFRPHAFGPLDATDMAIIFDLALDRNVPSA